MINDKCAISVEANDDEWKLETIRFGRVGWRRDGGGGVDKSEKKSKKNALNDFV
jgi:hypothetical protein